MPGSGLLPDSGRLRYPTSGPRAKSRPIGTSFKIKMGQSATPQKGLPETVDAPRSFMYNSFLFVEVVAGKPPPLSA